MGKFQRDKGNRIERELINRLKDSGIDAKRVPLSGMCEGFKGDIVLVANGKDLVAEVKSRAQASGWRTVKVWLGDNDLLFLREDREKDPLVVMRWEQFLEFIGVTR